MINNNTILKLKEHLNRYCVAVSENNALRNASDLSKLLITFNLTPESLFTTYTTDFAINKKLPFKL